MTPPTRAAQVDAFPMRVGGYRIDIVVQGYPGKSTHHGGLGWSTVVLLRGHGRVAVIDTGSFGMRRMIVDRLGELGVAPDQVTDLLLSHAHHDHIVNYPLFARATLAIGARELAWALTAPWGHSPVPELYVRELSQSPHLRRLEPGDSVLPGITADLAPGHTPGHLLFVLAGEAFDVIFLQDAVKTRAELISRETDMTYDAAISAATVEKVWSIWRRRPGSIVVPGHDLPMVLTGGEPAAIGRHRAGIKAALGDTLQDVTTFDLAS
jgi:N-acyl homoserine lactone hydrolase